MEESKRYELEEFVSEIEKHRARHTELITVYVPAGYDLNNIIKQLESEKSTAGNIKSKTTQKNVIDALESLVRQLRLIKRNPTNGLALFSGNVAEREGQSDVKVWSFEPPMPLKVRLYRCDQEFVLEPLREMLEATEIYGLVVIDRNEATLGLLEGKQIKTLQHMTSGVPGKTEKGGQCLAPETLVMKENGEIIEIKEATNPQTIIAVDFNNYSMISSDILDKWENKKQILKIRTKNPCFEIEASKDHLFFTKDGEKVAGNLKVGDYLLFPEKIKISGKEQKLITIKKYLPNKGGRDFFKKIRQEKILQRQLAKKLGVSQTIISKFELNERNMGKEHVRKSCKILGIDYKQFMSDYGLLSNMIKCDRLTENIAGVMGYFMGDGNYDKNRICFSEANKELVDFYVQLIKEIFGLESAIRFREKKNYYEVRVHSKELVEFMKLNFPELKRSFDTEIPKKVLMSEDTVLSAFLAGFFDAEGYVSKGIGLGTNNEKLSKQTQLCLLRLGIISSFDKYDNRRNPYSNNWRYTLEINDKKSLQLFLEKIDFIKNYKVVELIKRKSITDYTRQVLVDGREIKNLLFLYGEINASQRFGISSFLNSKRMMSKEIFRKNIINNVNNLELKEKLKRIMEREVVPTKITSIIHLGQRETVDISVKNHNFIANGLVVHNSAARYARIREVMAKEFFRRVAEAIKNNFWGMKKLKGIIVGGPGPTKEDFLKEGNIVTALREKIIGVKDIGYADPQGLEMLVEASKDVLAEQEITREKKILEDFFNRLGKQPEKTAYGLEKVKKALEAGAVDTLILSKKLGKKQIQELEEKAKNISAKIELVSEETEEGQQFKSLSGIGAILRFQIE